MINYGKVAFDKVNDVVRNKTERFDFCFKTINKQLTNNNQSFKLLINAKNKVYFKIDLNSKASLKVLVNGSCEYVNTNLISSNFELFINGNSLIEFCFFNFEGLINCSLQILGEFVLTDYTNLNLIPLKSNFLAIKPEENSFKVFTGENINQVVNNTNLNEGVIFNYKFLSVCEFNANTFCLVELNGNNYIIKNYSEVILLTKHYSTNAKVIKCNYFDSAFLIVDVVSNSFTVSLYSTDVNLIAYYDDIKLGKLSNIISVKEVYNNADSNIYFIVTDVNKCNYIVLCNFNENAEIKPIFNAMLISKEFIYCCEKTINNTFEICFKLINGIKFETLDIDFENNILALKVVNKFSSAKSGLKINGTMILNFSDVLEIF